MESNNLLSAHSLKQAKYWNDWMPFTDHKTKNAKHETTIPSANNSMKCQPTTEENRNQHSKRYSLARMNYSTSRDHVRDDVSNGTKLIQGPCFWRNSGNAGVDCSDNRILQQYRGDCRWVRICRLTLWVWISDRCVCHTIWRDLVYSQQDQENEAVLVMGYITNTVEDQILDSIQVGYTGAKERTNALMSLLIEDSLIYDFQQGLLDTILVHNVEKLVESYFSKIPSPNQR